MNETTQFHVLVVVERMDNEGNVQTLTQVGETVLLGVFDTLEDAQRFVGTLPRKSEWEAERREDLLVGRREAMEV